jgi:hypothetical protein
MKQEPVTVLAAPIHFTFIDASQSEGKEEKGCIEPRPVLHVHTATVWELQPAMHYFSLDKRNHPGYNITHDKIFYP